MAFEQVLCLRLTLSNNRVCLLCKVASFGSVLRVLIFWPTPRAKGAHNDMTSFIRFGEAAMGAHSASFVVPCASGENTPYTTSGKLYVESSFLTENNCF